jgi:hypothetical protein
MNSDLFCRRKYILSVRRIKLIPKKSISYVLSQTGNYLLDIKFLLRFGSYFENKIYLKCNDK